MPGGCRFRTRCPITTDIAEAATWVRGVRRAGRREIVIEGDDLLSVYRSFCAAILLTRTIAEAV